MHIIMQSADYDYQDGGHYVGSTKDTDGLPHGDGHHKLADGGQYTGEIRNGLFEGRGTLTCPDGTRFQGEFQNGKFHGLGVLTKPKGLTFCGEFRCGNINGKGLMTFHNGTHGLKRQEGIFENGVLTKAVECRSVIERATRISDEAKSLPS